MNLRKSMKTSKKGKHLKRKYFDMWNSNTTQSSDYTSFTIPITNKYSFTSMPNIFSDSAILNKLCKMSFDKTDKDDIENIETMRILLKKIKEDNEKIEKILNNHLDVNKLIKLKKKILLSINALKNLRQLFVN